MQKYFFIFISIGTLVMLLVMAKTGAPLKTVATPHGIIDLEFACNQQKLAVVMNAWKENGSTNNILTAKINTQLDFIFLLYYALFFNLACKKIAALFSGNFANWGLIIAAGAIGAGLFDILENIGMLLSLLGNINSSIPMATFIFSITKWLLVIIAAAYCIIGGLRLLINQLSKKNQPV